MYKYEKLADFLHKQLDKSKSDEEEKLIKIWKEKEKLIDRVMQLYWNVLEAYCNCHTAKSYFADELIKVDNLVNDIKNPDYKSEVSINSVHLDDKSPFKDDLLIEIYNKILSPDYNPKECNMFDKRDHLFALWFFYKMMPVLSKKPFPLTVVMQFDLSMAKLITVCAQLITALQYTGDHFDSEAKRFEAIRQARKTKENKLKVLKGYNSISINGQTKHGLAVQIREELKKEYIEESDIPSLDTIKRVLKKDKLPPFN